MKGKTRYILLVCGLVLYHYLLRYINDIWTNNLRHPSWKWRNELPYGLDSSYISSTPRRKSDASNHRNCRMETCFDFSKCKGDFKIYVYPEDELGGQQPPCESYEKVYGLHQLSISVTAPDAICRSHIILSTP